MFTTQDKKQIKDRGISFNSIEKQIRNFREGFPFLAVVAPATIGNGIQQISGDESTHYLALYEKYLARIKFLKFTPASGAATRMFKSLFEFQNDILAGKQNFLDSDFFEKLPSFAFYKTLKSIFQQRKGYTLSEAIDSKNYLDILSILLDKSGLNYENMPKGLIFFHQYAKDEKTALEEHLIEGANYTKDTAQKVHLHFTISPEHLKKFSEKIRMILKSYEKELNVKYNISFSIQKPATDTIAVNENNEPFRNEDGSLLFRPGGHGALIENLNQIDADIIFIKNIDNVVHGRLKQETIRYKKILAGLLLAVQEKIFSYLRKLDKNTVGLTEELEDFLQTALYIILPPDFRNYNNKEKIIYFRKKLHRPIRVCGMVKNEGEPGGGPFWANNPDGSISLQIAEANQINTTQSDKQITIKQATHFNPVDLVCAIKDYQGEKFDLLQYRDAQTGFISQKSKNGKVLKVQELPGLWNGAMSDWNTIFVEVPAITFNPVKTVYDLLRENHQMNVSKQQSLV